MEQTETGVFRIRGSVCFPGETGFIETLLSAVEQGGTVVADMSAVESLDSQALAGLVEAVLRAKKSGTRFAIEGFTPGTARVVQMSGLASELGLAPARIETAAPAMTEAALRRQEWIITESVVLAEPELVADLRKRAVEAAREVSSSEDLMVDVRLAVGEALVNALSHGSKGPTSRITLRCMTCPRAFVAEVIDCGGESSMPTSCDSSGLGTTLIKAAMDEVAFIPDGSGCRVRMLKWLPAGTDQR